MPEARLQDTGVSVVKPRKTEDGYLVATVKCARVGCQDYLPKELGMDGDDALTMYRPEASVFALDSMKSFLGKPVTIGHPKEDVSAENWKQQAVGDITAIARDGDYIVADIKIMDQAGIDLIEAGTRELSVGFQVDVALEDGVAPDGTSYQLKQYGPMKVNHLAIVDMARAGPECRIGDGASAWGASPIITREQEGQMPPELKNIVIGDQAVSVSVSDAAKIEAFKADTAKKISDMETKHAEDIAAKDKELGEVQAELKDAKDNAATPEKIEELAEKRSALVADAQKIAPDLDPKGLTDAGIRKAALKVHLGDSAKDLDDKSDAHLEGAFDYAVSVADAKPAKPPQSSGGAKLKPAKVQDGLNGWNSPNVVAQSGVGVKKEN